MQQITLGRWTSISPNENRYRAYTMYLAEDLWGNVCLVRAWGRIGYRPREKFYWPSTDEELTQLLQQTVQRRIRHGYRARYGA